MGARLARDAGDADFQVSRRLFREQALLPQKSPRHKFCVGLTIFLLTDIEAILPLFFCLEISRILPAGNFIAGLKYMTQALD
ncbi:hypothetical protein EMIT043CA1_130058 [Pseudomonas brassicacearum]|uniref:hypothetical protein n=1 Tax=Pseudomonas brassicacearum TaxID=930166 RepID=UPI0005794038|nr:hypothetical protein [Pseudomonas brassicacearum]